MRRRGYLAVVASGIMGFTGCASPATPKDTPDSGEGDRERPTQIHMITAGSEFVFDPVGLLVEPGTTITWVLESGSHSTTAYEVGNGPAAVTRIPTGAEAWDSGVMKKSGATFEQTFETPGTYDYFCMPHKPFGMVGRIVVARPGGPAAGTMPPDGQVPDSETIMQEGIVPSPRVL